MEHKWRVTNEAEESIVMIAMSISDLPESFSLTDKEMTDTVKIERIVEIDFGEEILARLKEQQKIVMCKDCKYYDGNGTCMKNGIASLTDHWFCADGERS